MIAHPRLSRVKPHLNVSQFIVLSFNCPTSGPVQDSSILHILDTQRVCSVSLTIASANFCSLMREYHRMFFTQDSALAIGGGKCQGEREVHLVSTPSVGFLDTSYSILTLFVVLVSCCFIMFLVIGTHATHCPMVNENDNGWAVSSKTSTVVTRQIRHHLLLGRISKLIFSTTGRVCFS